MKRLGFISGLVVVIVLVGAVAASAQAGRHLLRPAAERFSGPITLKRNKADARADARYLVHLVKLPDGTVKDKKYRPGKLTPLESVLTDKLDAEEYTVPKGAADPYSYVLKHRPGGVKNDGGFGPDSNGSRGLMYDFRAIRGRVFGRMLEVWFTPKRNGSTLVLVESQSNWVIPRPKSERVPAAATQVVISTSFNRISGSSGESGATVYPTISKRSKVRELIKIVDAPPIAQDMVSAGCGAWSGNGTLHAATIRFDNKHGRVLATVGASWVDHQAVGDWCNPLTFKLGHKSEPDLIDTHMLFQVGKLTGDKLK